MLLLYQGLPRTTVTCLRVLGLEVEHVGDIGLAAADDRSILDRACERGQTVVPLDADFQAQLALSRASAPSVIRIRVEGLRAEQLAQLLAKVLERCTDDLKVGSMITVTEFGVRVGHLPLIRPRTVARH